MLFRSFENKGDITYNFIQRGIWTIIEANLGIISACLPILKQPLSRAFPRLFGSAKKGSSYRIDDGPKQESGYSLSSTPGQGPAPGPWRGPIRSRQTTSISGPEKAAFGRKSDELYIITPETMKGNNGGHCDSDLDSPGSYEMGGISKRV